VLLLCALGAILGCLGGPTCAGEVNVTWDLSDGATGYRVYSGVQAGVYGDPQDVPGPPLAYTVLLDGCVQQFMAVTAYNVIGESGFSNELTLYPRPVFIGDPTLVNNDTIIELNGGNFAPGLTLTMNTLPVPFTVNSCTKISIPVVTVPGLGQGQPVTIEVCNGTVCQQSVMLPVTTPTSFGAS
jgi:hypothetical protein